MRGVIITIGLRGREVGREVERREGGREGGREGEHTLLTNVSLLR